MAKPLSPAQKKKLLELAREAVEAAVREQLLPSWEIEAPELLERRGAFVTLRKGAQLRGCIGYPEPTKPLWQAVADAAQSAALRDPRFEPVTEEELEQIEIEISVLSPMEKVEDVNEIEVGKHGLVIRQGNQGGLLLPQVATERGWSRTKFLQETCLKAGLPQDAWQKGAQIFRFSAEVFSESEVLE